MQPTEPTANTDAPIWLWPNLIGLDAPLVAVCWQWFFSNVFHIPLPPVFHLILGLSVWCIYLADRLYDAAKTKHPQRGTRRMTFTHRYFRHLMVTVVLLAVANLFLIIQNVSYPLVRNGLVVTFFLVIYYIIRFLRKNRLSILIPREIFCGFLFSIGTALATWTLAPPSLEQTRFLFATFCFGILCSANCILISIWEKEQDSAVDDRSIANISGAIRPLILRNASVLILIGATLVLIEPWQYFLAIGLGAAGLAFLVVFQSRLSLNALRVLADVSLLTPLAIGAIRFLW